MAVNRCMVISRKGFKSKTDYTDWEANSEVLLYSALMVEAACSSETLVLVYYTTQRRYLCSHLRENLTSGLKLVSREMPYVDSK
jgi:hypothetical protein